MIRKLNCLVFGILLLISFISPVNASNTIDLNKKGSIKVTLQDIEENNGIKGAELTIYKVADAKIKNHNLYYEYTEDFKECAANLNKLNDDNFANEVKKCFKSELVGKSLITDSNGIVEFKKLDLGLYLIRQTNNVKGYSKIDSFLSVIPKEENNSFVYDVNAYPKTDIYKTIDLTIIKKWNATKSEISDSVKVALYDDEEVVDTVILNNENNWTYVFEDIPKSANYRVEELEIPTNFVATYEQDGNVFTVTNTDKLVQTGQIFYPIIILSTIGVISIIVGIYDIKRKENV